MTPGVCRAGLAQIVFPIGGIGAGSVGLTGRGGLTDWEIFNRPNVGGGGGDPHVNGEGFPHMDSATFTGEYLFARIDC